ncbi:MAG: hypothetical protein ACLFNO_03500 [Parcubacteria group bacterium]
MENSNFSEKNREKIENNQNDVNNKSNDVQGQAEKVTKIVFDRDQLEYIKFRLTFSDGYMFGLGFVFAIIVISIIIFFLLFIIGFSFTSLLLNSLM